mmetsp:Transcript_20828/g.61681  ORF Transcript_20828/g.61681 Transcript_20828/m.61681 type:complete len:236 (+) Transcript_20828:90-797(+)
MSVGVSAGGARGLVDVAHMCVVWRVSLSVTCDSKIHDVVAGGEGDRHLRPLPRAACAGPLKELGQRLGGLHHWLLLLLLLPRRDDSPQISPDHSLRLARRCLGRGGGGKRRRRRRRRAAVRGRGLCRRRRRLVDAEQLHPAAALEPRPRPRGGGLQRFFSTRRCRPCALPRPASRLTGAGVRLFRRRRHAVPRVAQRRTREQGGGRGGGRSLCAHGGGSPLRPVSQVWPAAMHGG